MKKIIIVGIGIIALSVNLISCKKGENDPFLSLSTRKARLVGEWTLTKIEGTYSDIYPADTPNNETSTTTYSNGLETVTTVDGSGSTSVSTDTYTVTYSFTKDRKYTITTTKLATVEVEEGDWLFMGKNKNQNLKKKEAIYLYITKWVQTDNNGVSQTVSITGIDMTADVLEIDQLKSKEIILINENTNVQGSTTDSNKTTYTLTAK